MIKSLRATGHSFADASAQVRFLELEEPCVPSFAAHAGVCLTADGIRVLQVNLGKMCNQTCRHCHVDAGPDRKEIMTAATVDDCLRALQKYSIPELDLTGGAPEMNPEFRRMVTEAAAMGVKITVRCNLTIILANAVYRDLPEFFKAHGVTVVSSLPYYRADRTDRQRGEGVFERSMKALKMLNVAGYGMDGTGLMLHLVYNPAGAFLPSSQAALEKEFKQELQAAHGIYFNELYAITNMPISRFLDYLVQSDNYETYMHKLLDAYNPVALENVMCKYTLSVGWDGRLYDCDFNQMLELPVTSGQRHISELDPEGFLHRRIVTGRHCYGCTAGSGSGCGGQTVG